MNILTIHICHKMMNWSYQYIKKSPGNSAFPGLLHIIFNLRIQRDKLVCLLYNTLSGHRRSTKLPRYAAFGTYCIL